MVYLDNAIPMDATAKAYMVKPIEVEIDFTKRRWIRILDLGKPLFRIEQEIDLLITHQVNSIALFFRYGYLANF